MVQTVKIKDKEYKLKVTLGLYKNLSFPRSELETIYIDAKRLGEVLELALYYGNKALEGWQSLPDMKKVITDDDIDDIDDNNLIVKIDQAILENLPDQTQKAIKEANGDQEDIEESKKK